MATSSNSDSRSGGRGLFQLTRIFPTGLFSQGSDPHQPTVLPTDNSGRWTGDLAGDPAAAGRGLMGGEPAIVLPLARGAAIRRVEELLLRGVNTIVTGPVGIGKSHLINAVRYPMPVLEMDDMRDLKRSLAHCLLHLLGDKDEVARLIYGTDSPDSLSVKVSKESLPNLCRLLTQACPRKSYILKIGEIDTITPLGVRTLESLKDHFVILTTSRAVKLTNSSFIWDFEKVVLEPLSRADSTALFRRLTQDLELPATARIQTRIYETAGGNPRMITELAERIGREPERPVSAARIDAICDEYLGRQTREIDASPYLLALFSTLIIYRYIGRETGEHGLQFIGGVIMIIVLFCRHFFRGSRRKNL